MNSKSTNLLPLFGAHLIQALNTTLQSEEERRGLFRRKESNWIHKMKKKDTAPLKLRNMCKLSFGYFIFFLRESIYFLRG